MSCHLDNTTVLLQIRPGYVPSMMLTGFELGARGNVASDVQSPEPWTVQVQGSHCSSVNRT